MLTWRNRSERSRLADFVLRCAQAFDQDGAVFILEPLSGQSVAVKLRYLFQALYAEREKAGEL